MTKLDASSTLANPRPPELGGSPPTRQSQDKTLRTEVEKALWRYFQHIGDEPVTGLHRMVMSEVEAPLLEAVMRHTDNNQSKASVVLGMNRGTLRSKLKQHGLL